LTQIFVGSEGTLGVVTGARLRVHPVPTAEDRRAWSFPTFGAGLEACRRILRRGATPAVLRLYDRAESDRHFPGAPGCVLVTLDEGDPSLVEASLGIAARECGRPAAEDLGPEPVDRWMATRNDVPSLAGLADAGIVADTVEVAAAWSALPAIHREVVARLTDLAGTVVASAHQSHAYRDGACLYFTFAGRPGESTADAETAERYYRAAWDAVIETTLGHGGALSHHHGIGINRGRYLADDLGAGFDVLSSLKAALDPVGILNPGKLGLPSPFGPPPWP
ncbi:MAG TPA: FAD-linked oxidase C-terminal domain-containing protein, partial [Acidimicrobiales bacterium]|nr:FAD-linked oxidase C-terminal domain-containing protein [Acidimicrobiales bacterium]